MRFGRRAAALLATLSVGALGAACAPPTDPNPPLAACPARTSVVLEAPSPSQYSLPRAVSPDGEWVVVSRVIGSDVQFSIRRTLVGAPSQLVGTLPYSALTNWAPLVSVAADGEWVLFGQVGEAAVPEHPQTELYRWTRATGVTATVDLPVVPDPPPGVGYPVNLRRLSEDGRRIFWTQSFYEAPSTFHHVTTVIDAATDQVVTRYDSPSNLFAARLSSGGHRLTTGDAVVEVDTGISTSLVAARAAVVAQFGGNFGAVNSSDDGRFTVFQRLSGGSGAPMAIVLWNHQDDTAEQVDLGDLDSPLAVTDEGDVLYQRRVGTTAQIVVRELGGTVRVIAAGQFNATWPTDVAPYSGVVAKASTDLRTILYSEAQVALGNRMVARRCV